MDVPHFDVIMDFEFEDERFSTVVHRNAQGKAYAFHTALDDGPIGCTICETPGNRVYMEFEE